MSFSSMVLNPSSTFICESPVRLSIVVSHAGGLVLLCHIFHLRASFRPDLLVPFAYHFCKHGWTPSGLLSVLNCVPLHNTGAHSWTPPMLPRSCISLFAGNLPSRKPGSGGRAQTMSRFFVRVMFLLPPNFPKSPDIGELYGFILILESSQIQRSSRN